MRRFFGRQFFHLGVFSITMSALTLRSEHIMRYAVLLRRLTT